MQSHIEITRWAQARDNLTRLWQPGYNLVTRLSTCYKVVTTLYLVTGLIVNKVVTIVNRIVNLLQSYDNLVNRIVNLLQSCDNLVKTL